jgi:hypothetical protein
MIWTIKRLAAVKPSQTITYYRGDFERDIRACVDCGTAPPAYKYQAVLIKIQEEARKLERLGRIKLSKHRQWMEKVDHRGVLHHFWIDEYLATGATNGEKARQRLGRGEGQAPPRVGHQGGSEDSGSAPSRSDALLES